MINFTEQIPTPQRINYFNCELVPLAPTSELNTGYAHKVSQNLNAWSNRTTNLCLSDGHIASETSSPRTFPTLELGELCPTISVISPHWTSLFQNDGKLVKQRCLTEDIPYSDPE